ncbi:MAG: hypothetical protein R3D62_00120 [Xanthobacteraceae bacterium]
MNNGVSKASNTNPERAACHALSDREHAPTLLSEREVKVVAAADSKPGGTTDGRGKA